MIQELASTSFDTYFNVSSSNNRKIKVDHNKNISSPTDNVTSSTNQDLKQSAYFSMVENSRQGRYLFDFEQRNDMAPMNPDTVAFKKRSPQQLLSKEESTYSNLNFNLKNEATKALNTFFIKKNEHPSIPSLEYTYEGRSVKPDLLPSPPHNNHASSSSMPYSFRSSDFFFNSEKYKDNRYWDEHINSGSDVFTPKKEFKKVAHNVIERRYRNNINDRIQELKDNVPALYKAQIKDGHHNSPSHDDFNDSDTEIIEGVEVAKKLNKATVLKKATEYIKSLKRTQEKVSEENSFLQNIISQMPNGHQVLSRFLYQKSDLEQAENERLSRERQKAQEQARLDRKRVLRERAAERAALAQIIPKPERKPYKRRQQKKKINVPQILHHSEHGSDFFGIMNNIQQVAAQLAFEFKIRNVFYCFLSTLGLLYMCLVPLAFYWLQPRPAKRTRNQAKHIHYFKELTIALNCLRKTIYSYILCEIGLSRPVTYFSHERKRSSEPNVLNDEHYFDVPRIDLGKLALPRHKKSGYKAIGFNNSKYHTILKDQLKPLPPSILRSCLAQYHLQNLIRFLYKEQFTSKEGKALANTQYTISKIECHHSVSPSLVSNGHFSILWRKVGPMRISEKSPLLTVYMLEKKKSVTFVLVCISSNFHGINGLCIAIYIK